MATTISTQDIIDAKRDIDDIGKAVNENTIVSPRYGEDFKSLPMIAAEAQATIGEWQDAINTIVIDDGVPALAVSDASGKNQQQINNNTAYYYSTVAEMVADESLTDSDIVATKGYHNIFDDGGTIYLISSVATDYSIPIANGLHAVFRDTFDIRKFGVRNDATLDQSNELRRMVAYADDRFYEIDFLNFKIMTPDNEQGIKTGEYRFIKGLIFNKVHKIKNLHIANNKTKQLRYNTVCLAFLPKTDGVGTFELENVTFDPYVSNFAMHPTSFDGDGYMHGFTAAWHSDFPTEWPANQQFKTGYSIKFNGINFISPAVSYNLATNFWCDTISIKEAKGDYWGLYLWHWCDKLYAENVSGVFRDDLHTGSGRVLVTSLLHEEQEVGSSTFSYNQALQQFKNISVFRKSNNQPYIAIKRLTLGAPIVERIDLENITGTTEFFAGADKAGLAKLNNVNIRNCHYDIKLIFDTVNVNVYNSTLSGYLFTQPAFSVSSAYLYNTKLNFGIAYNGVVIDVVRLLDCNLASSEGIARASVYYKKVYMVDTDVNGGRVIEGKFDSIHLMGGEVAGNYFSEFIKNTKNDGTASTVRMNGVRFVVDKGDAGNLISAVSGQPITARVRYCDFVSKPNFNLGTAGTLVYNYNTPVPNASKTYDPPSLGAGLVQSTTLTVNGVSLGDAVTCSFNQPLLGTRMWAEVTASNVVTVYQQNPTAAAVDVASGTLTVKAI